MTNTAHFQCRDIGYGIESGDIELPALGGPDWTGKSPYRTMDGDTVYLFDDELCDEPIFCEACQGNRAECGPMRDTATGWIGLRHLPNLGKLADRRQGGR